MANEIRKIKSLSFISVSSLIFQSSYSAVLGFIAFFILTLKSGVYLLGIYNTVLAMMSFFNYLTNLGLAAAIVQKEKVEEIDLNTVFIIQFILSTIAVIFGFFLTNKLFTFYKDLPPQATYLYWSILISFFFISLKTIPSVLLEKKIEIYKVVLVQAIENTIFYVCVIVFSIMGMEIYSLAIAVLARSIIGTVSMFILNPWVPNFSFSFNRAKSLLKYGLTFQGNSFLALIKDDLLIIYLGSVIGFKNLGYVTFGKKYAEYSIRLVMDNINRVAFPLFSKFQKDVNLLRKSLEKVLFYESLLIFPIIIGALFVFDSLLKILPGYYLKWNQALFSFYFFSLSAFFISLSTPFINLFNAISKVKVSLFFMIVWTVLIWILVPFFVKFFGFNSISIAFFIMSLTFIFVILTAKKYIIFSLSTALKTTLTATMIMTIYLSIILLIRHKFGLNLYVYLIISILGAALIYFLVIYKNKGKLLFDELSDLLTLKK